MISRGVPVGASNPVQPVMTTVLNPASVMLGASGNTGDRAIPHVASNFSLPALICGTTPCMGVKIKAICPLKRSTTAGVSPLYGTCSMRMPICDENNSPPKCVWLPMPKEPKPSSPGRAFASATRSFTLLTGSEGLITSPKVLVAVCVIGAKSRSVSYGSDL